jgi:type I restriction enzyme S subunit
MTLTHLGDIVSLRAGVAFPLDLQGRPAGDYPLAKVGDISKAGRNGKSVLSSSNHYVDKVDLKRLGATPIPQGSVLFAKIGEAIRQNHRVIAGCPLLVDNNAMAAIPTARIESRYLYHFLRTVDLYRMASATTVPSLRKTDLASISVPLPPLPEQRRIADVLDRAEALRAKRRAALAQLDTLTQSIFLDMFGDPVAGDMGWPIESIASIASGEKHAIVDGPFGSSLKRHHYKQSGIPVIRIGNVSKGGEFVRSDLLFIDRSVFESLRRSRIWPQDVLITRVGTLGNSCIFPDDIGDALLSTTGVCKITVNPSRVLPVFLHAAIRMPTFQEQIHRSASTSVQKYFNLTALRSWHLAVPPIAIQRVFADRVAMVETLREQHRVSQARFDALFASIQLRAFSGEL